jgi:hypothetical protein
MLDAIVRGTVLRVSPVGRWNGYLRSLADVTSVDGLKIEIHVREERSTYWCEIHQSCLVSVAWKGRRWRFERVSALPPSE